jgi:hypothetical protein
VPRQCGRGGIGWELQKVHGRMWPEITRLVAPRRAPHQRYRPLPPDPRLRRGLYAGEPETCRRDPRQFLAITAHLGLLLAVLKVYRIEGRAFQLLVTLALAALPVHYALPLRWKKPFFVGASVVGLTWVFGLPVALTVLLLAGGLIAVCYLPFAWTARAGIVALAAAALALARGSVFHGAVPELAWPVLGSMLMFRMILYLYELKHANRPERLLDTLSYFFVLPNYCFLHFPVVDYKTFLRGYFADDIHSIQRRGLGMMVRGTVHLLLYRLVYHDLLVPPEEVDGLRSLAGYLACNYLLYLRVSGQFHTACGMLHLFGWQLPATHHNYLLATGFTDYWRRINIYWKDFMVRVVFNPVVFALKRRPQTWSLAAGTTAVFVATWLLHAYQAFWLKGSFNFGATDACFWAILGSLVLINVQRDARAGRRARNLELAPGPLALRAIKTAGTFATIALLWSLWSSRGIGAWFGLLRRGLHI